MDAAAQLALMAKAANVFSSDDTFLSFPVTSLSYKKARLNLLDDATYANIIEFSMITNMIPTGIAWDPMQKIFYGMCIKASFRKQHLLHQQEQMMKKPSIDKRMTCYQQKVQTGQ